MLISAKAIFQELAASATDYGAYYNLGNALSGLQEYADARDAYLEALNFNDKVAEAWKNLGSCYFHLGEHDKELECYNTALRLNPRLSHALVSKANTTAAVFHDYSEALSLLDQAASADKEIGRRWPHFHWWKAFYLFQLDRLAEALAVTNSGLNAHPDHERLLDLKARILSVLWRREPSFRPVAQEYFNFRLQAEPGEVPSLVELAELAAAEERTNQVVEYLARAFNAASGDNLAKSDFENLSTSNQLLALARHLPAYIAYRRSHPLTVLNEIVDLERRYGYRYLWVVFGLAFVALSHDAPKKESTQDDILEFYHRVRASVKHAISTVAARIGYEFLKSDTPTKTAVLSVSLIALAEAAFYEVTGLCGYLPAANGVQEDVFAAANEQFIQQNELNPYRPDAIDAILTPLNDIWHLFPDTERGRKE